MSIFDRSRQVTKVFQRLGIWSIPLLSTPLILPFALLQTRSPSPPAIEQLNTSTSTVGEWKPVIQPNINKSNNSTERTSQPKTSPQKATDSRINKTHKSSNTSAATKSSAKSVKHSAKSRQQKRKKVAKQYTPPAIEIRVAIANDVDSLAIGSSTPAYIQTSNGKTLQTLPAAQGFLAQSTQESNIAIGDRQLPNLILIQPTKGGAVYVGDRWYRGKLLLVSQNNKLLAVNYVDLEHYLSSVVGSEMHAGAPIEALKAQAVAARSYALVHMVRPASSWYNLGNTQRWQVYKGMNSEYNTTQKAVKDTAGQFVSYKGGIVESLYASTDEIVTKAHGGMGMSQTGAYQLAAQGYNYQQILGYYYPGTATARLQLKK